MTSKRPYRDPLKKETVLEELTKGRDKQHCAQIIDAFLGLLKKDPSFWNLSADYQ
jgi:HD-GYP domain-containing protein (c-di-GMP phosphodiesterase class II)